MKTIGLVGGMSWESTAIYYRALNREVQARLGGQHSARIVMVSVDFHDVVEMQQRGDWDAAGALLADAAHTLERAGADFGLLCTNTMHRVFDAMTAGTKLPFLHLADATAEALVRAGHRKVGLLGTRYTMEQAFYRDRIASHGIEVLVPDADGRDLVHTVIYDELCKGVVRDASRGRYVGVIEQFARDGATAVILGCTEIGMLIDDASSPLPTFDTSLIHARVAVDRALG
jgi:aspartate racemase